MRLTDELRRANEDLWPSLTAHPFVTAAADGTLPAEAFDRWIVSDHAFVVAFRRFLGGLIALAPHEAARDLLAGSLSPLQDELHLFRRQAELRDLDLETEPALVGLGYAAYLLASLADGWPTAITILYGAEKAYSDAWTAVRATAAHDSPYWPFIDNWSSTDFAAWVDRVGALVDDLPPAEHKASRVAFRRVVRFERAFWDGVLPA